MNHDCNSRFLMSKLEAMAEAQEFGATVSNDSLTRLNGCQRQTASQLWLFSDTSEIRKYGLNDVCIGLLIGLALATGLASNV